MTTRRASLSLAAALLLAGAGLASPALAVPHADEPSASSTRPAGVAAVTPGVGPVSVSIVVPLTVSPSETGLLTAEELERYTAPTGPLTRKLDAIIGTPVAIGVDPMIVASIRVLGSSAPPSALQWLARLEGAANESFPLAYADADLVAAARSDTLSGLTPSGFGFAIDPDDFSPPAAPSPSPSPEPPASADPDAAPPLPTTADVLAWTSSLPRIAWPVDATIGAGDIPPLVAAGYDRILLSSDEVGSDASPLVDLDGARGIVADSTMNALLRDALSSFTDADLAAALDALEGGLAARAQVAPGRGLVLTVGRDWPFLMQGLPAALSRIQASADAQLVPLSDILGLTPTAAMLGDGEPTAERDAAFRDVRDDISAERLFSTVLTDPAPLLDARTLERIALYSVGWTKLPEAWTTAVEAFRTRSDEIRSSVKIEHGNDVVLLASSAGFRVAVSNALPYPVTVRVSVVPRSPILQVQGGAELTVEPESTGTAYLPVQAVANGQVLVESSLTSPTGVPIDSGFSRVTVQAEWEGIGTLVVVGLLVVIFGAGIVRLVLRRRKARAAAADGADRDADADADADAEGTDG
ncbi:hypothetical protein FLP23_02775 [Protaetiibacter larvae]|uniref:Uncharacterized protein n=1 Tax=Protaetiibacter larvae TaxID=2592654 RepID=A0A5C1Y4S4_9MICO|nr:hypothetical protein FLP23_02775 [Protaetiibacter larvae]